MGELVSEGPLVAASYPRQTLDPGKVSTVDTGYTTVVPAVDISITGRSLPLKFPGTEDENNQLGFGHEQE